MLSFKDKDFATSSIEERILTHHLKGTIMPSFLKKIFGGKKNGKHGSTHDKSPAISNQNDNMYTTIIATKSQRKFADDVMDCLQRSGEVIVDGKDDVVSGSGNARANAQQALHYMNQTKVTAVIILSSDELENFFTGSNSVQLQVTGENVNLDANVIAESFRNNNEIRRKLLVVVLPGKSASYPSFLRGVDVVQLGSDKRIWNKEIVGRFMQKNTLHN